MVDILARKHDIVNFVPEKDSRYFGTKTNYIYFRAKIKHSQYWHENVNYPFSCFFEMLFFLSVHNIPLEIFLRTA